MTDILKKKIIQAQQGDKASLNEIVKDNVGLIYNISKRFANRGYDIEDINQIGAIGLIKAIQKFDFSYNVELSTFAVSYILGEIKRFLRDDGPIKISRQIKELSVKIKRDKEKNSNISVSELTKKYNVDKEEIILALESSFFPESLDRNIDDDSDDEFCLLDKLQSKNFQEDNILNRIELNKCIENLDEREKEIILLRYFKGQTQKSVAKMIGISQVQVSRIEKHILNNMREKMIS